MHALDAMDAKGAAALVGRAVARIRKLCAVLRKKFIPEVILRNRLSGESEPSSPRCVS